MSEDFDPYYKWLAIPPSDQPPNFYRLLSIPLYESDQEVIGAAAVQRLNWVRNFQHGTTENAAIQLSKEIADAWMCLRNPEHKEEYDEQIKRHTAAQQIVPPHVAPTLFAAANPSAPPPSNLSPSDGNGSPDFCDLGPPSSAAHGAPDPSFSSSDLIPKVDGVRRPARRTSGINFFIQVIAGPIGLVLGYIILCLIGPQYDFLHLWFPQPPANNPNPPNAPGWPFPKPPKPKPNPPIAPTAAPQDNQPKMAPEPQIAPQQELAGAAPIPEAKEPSPDQQQNEPAPALPNEKPQEKRETEPSAQSDLHAVAINSVIELQQAVNKCRTAKQVLQIVKETIAKSISQETREYAQSQLPLWEDRAAKDCVRFGNDSWPPREEAVLKRSQANDLLTQAAGLLSLGNDQQALDRLSQARNLDPEATTAVFLLGVHWALKMKNYQEAKKCFAECLRRRPNDVGALIDLGLANLMLSRHKDALDWFRQAAASNPQSIELAHNLRRIVAQQAIGNVILPPKVATAYAELLKVVINGEAVVALDNAGWLYVQPATAPADSGLPAEVTKLLDQFIQSKTEKTVKIHPQWIEDRQCLWCLGAGSLPCTNRDCNYGKITVQTGQERYGTDPLTKAPLYRPTFGQKDCPICKGKGHLTCEKCSGTGVDPATNGTGTEVSKR